MNRSFEPLQQQRSNPNEPDTVLDALHELAKLGDSMRCLQLMAQPTFRDVNSKDRLGRTALHFAADNIRPVFFFML